MNERRRVLKTNIHKRVKLHGFCSHILEDVFFKKTILEDVIQILLGQPSKEYG